MVTREGFGCAEQKSADGGRQPTAAGWATPTKGSTQIPQSGSKTSTKTQPLACSFSAINLPSWPVTDILVDGPSSLGWGSECSVSASLSWLFQGCRSGPPQKGSVS